MALRRSHLATLAPVAAALVLATTASAPAAPVVSVLVRDAADTPGGLDLTRVQVGRAADGRLRAVLTLAAPWRRRDLVADEGPPGSLCLRLWTRSAPPATPPDYLVCLTADRGARHMRGSVLVENAGALDRVAGATVARTSDRTAAVRFPPGAVGDPARIRFAAEATAPGCARPECVDSAPNAPAVATLTLRSR